MTTGDLSNRLAALPKAQFEWLIDRLRVPPGILSGETAAPLQRAIEVLRYFQYPGRTTATIEAALAELERTEGVRQAPAPRSAASDGRAPRQPAPGRRRAVVLTALPVEYMSVRAHLVDLRPERHKRTRYERGRFGDGEGAWEVGIAEIGQLDTTAAQAAERAIDYFDPAVILFVGVAGGRKDVGLGDVVAASKVYGYESGSDGEVFKPRPELFRTEHGLEQSARAVARTASWLTLLNPPPARSPHAFVGPIAAGGKVVKSSASATARLLDTSYGDALCVDMEDFGLGAAAHANPDVAALAVRGISDLLDNKADTDRDGWQRVAAERAAAFALAILADESELPLVTPAQPTASAEPAPPLPARRPRKSGSRPAETAAAGGTRTRTTGERPAEAPTDPDGGPAEPPPRTVGEALGPSRLLDRHGQWTAIHEVFRDQPKRDACFLLYGPHVQHLRYFCDRLRFHGRQLDGRPRVVTIPYAEQESTPITVNQWEMRLLHAAGATSIANLLGRTLSRQPLLAIVEVPFHDAFDEQHHRALLGFLAEHLPPLLAQSSPKARKPLRLLVAIDYGLGNQGRACAFRDALMAAHKLAEADETNPLHRVHLEILAEVEMPPWSEVEAYLFKQKVGGRRLDATHPKFAYIERAYDEMCKSEAASFRELAELLDRTLQE